MRQQYLEILKEMFFVNLIQTRAKLGLSQAEMAGILAMDVRSYADIERKHNSCSALTLALFLVYCCSDSSLFLRHFRNSIEGEANSIA